jgi:hypothetical protein
VCWGQQRAEYKTESFRSDYGLDGNTVAGPPGHQELTVEVLLGERFTPTPIGCRQKARALVEVLPADGDDPVSLVQSPEMDAAIENAIRHVSVSTCGKKNCLSVSVPAPGTLPVACAFEVFAVFSGKEYPRGELVISKDGEKTWIRCACDALPDEPPDRVDILLRASTRVAKQTLDLGEIWGGELTFTDVEIERE